MNRLPLLHNQLCFINFASIIISYLHNMYKSKFSKLCFSIAIVLCLSVQSWANQGTISIETPSGRIVTATAINDNIIKVTNVKAGEVIPQSHSVILAPQEFKGETSSQGNIKMLSTPTGVVVVLNGNDGSISINAGNDRMVADNGVRSIIDGKQQLALATTGVGSYYGAGERGHSLPLNGDTLVMYNKQNYSYMKGEKRINQMNITMPLFVSSNGYAVLFDDYAAAEMIMGNPVKYITEGKEPVSYYFINGGGTLEGVMKEYTLLTGRQELPPFWAMGYITSKYGYKTEAETRGVIDTLKREGYPVDGVVLDLYWYGKEQDMGRLSWDPDQWPTHKKMLSDLKKKGVNTIIISQPYVLTNGRAIDNYNELSSKGMFCRDSVGNTHEVTIWVGSGGMFDVSNPDTRKWLRDRYKLLTDEGVGGWWGDLGEPEVHPFSIYHHNGKTAREYHNLYGNEWSRIIYDLYKEEYPNTRLMTMMRGGTAGLQRFSVYPWSTDVSRSWGGLQPQVTIMLNSGLSGMGYMSHDVGGFAIDPANPVDPELYVRWLQLGTFSPILRTHSQQVAEPYKYPEQCDIILDLINERYRWLPYNYTLAYENASQGLPMVRPLNFYSKQNTRFDNIDDQYLWGRDVMVAPVMTQGATSRIITFPCGRWVDYNNPTKTYNCGQTINYAAPLEVLPLFVRAGAFIPQADYKMGNTGDYTNDQYTVKYFPVDGVKSSYTMFEDDRMSTRSLADNAYRLITFTGDATANATTITLKSEGTYAGAKASKKMTIELNGITTRPAKVTINGKKASVKYNAKNSTATITFNWNVANEATIVVNK